MNVLLFGGIPVAKPVIMTILIGFVIYPIMINMKFEEVFAHFKEPRPLFCSLALTFIVSPLLAFGLGSLFLRDQPEFMTAFVLLAIIPTSAMAFFAQNYSKRFMRIE